MTWVKSGPLYQLRLEQDEDIPSMLVEFVKQHDIGSGAITGLGAAKDLILGYFDFGEHEYRKRRFPGEYELASIVGNIARDGRTPVCHLHAVISGPRMTVHAGHLFAGKVTATCEITITAGTRRLKRSTDPTTGLKLLDLPNRQVRKTRPRLPKANPNPP